MKPRVFVGSSQEHLAIARAIQSCLKDDADVTVWQQGVFQISQSALDSLLATLDRTDYGVFVLAADDLVTIQGQDRGATRDNVVFELGLFMGRLGGGNCFLVAPEGLDLRVPTDLLGITLALYDPRRARNEPESALATACHEIRKVIERPSTGTVTRIADGFRLRLSPEHCLELVTGCIQNVCPDKDHGAVVLPANTTFDDECIDDRNSALGAYFQAHLQGQVSEVAALIQQELATRQGTSGARPAAYPAGTTVYLDQPLDLAHRIIIAAVTEKIAGAGIQADTLSLVASLKGVMRLASDKRISDLWMPVLGTGHGGLDFFVALTMMVVQLSHGILREGYHCIHRAVVTVYDPEGRRAEQIERLAKAFPAMVRT